MLNYHEATLTMIDYEYNDYQPKPEPEQPHTTNSDDTVKWLDEHCGFRPFGMEW